MPCYLQAGHSHPHRPDKQEVIGQELLQLGDAAALRKPAEAHRVKRKQEPIKTQSPPGGALTSTL